MKLVGLEPVCQGTPGRPTSQPCKGRAKPNSAIPLVVGKAGLEPAFSTITLLMCIRHGGYFPNCADYRDRTDSIPAWKTGAPPFMRNPQIKKASPIPHERRL